MNFTKSKSAKFAAGVVGFAIALAFVVTPVTSSAQSTADLQAQIAGLLAQIAQLQAAMGGGGTMTVAVPVAPLTLGSNGGEVSKLQNFLINKGFSIPAGATGYFGAQTQAALAAFQAANGIVPAVGYYGPITAAKLSSMGGAMVDNGGGSTGTVTGLQGGAGDITVTERNSGVDDEVLEGEDEVNVLGFEIEADGSDVAITSVRVEFEHDGSGSDRLNRYVDEVSIMMGNKVVGSARARDFSESSDVYSKNIPVKATVKEDAKDRFYVAVTALSNIDSDDIGQDWEVALGSIRFQDATGAILSDTTGTGVNGTITETFTFEDLSSSGDIELKVSEDDNDINESQTVEVDDSSDTNNVEILSFSLEAEGSDIFLETISFGVTSNSGTGVTEIANDFRLMMDGDEVGRATIDRDCDGGSDGFASNTDEAICVTISDLDDDDVVIEEGDEVSFMLVADINDVDGGFSSGDTLSVTLNGDTTLSSNGEIDADDENGDALTASELSGSADSTNIEFLSTGVSVKTVSTNVSVDTKVSDVATDDQGVFTIVFDVTALGEDAYIELGTATRGTTESNTGANFIIQDAPNSYAATTSGSIALADITRVSGGTTSGNFVKVGDGQTARFQLVVYFDPAGDHVTGSSVGYRMRLYSVNSAETAVDATAQQVLTPEADYRTGAISVGN